MNFVNIVVAMKLIIVIAVIVLISLILFTYMSHASSKKVERQQYTVVKKEDGFEIRFYPKAIMATVNATSGANQNFRTLAGYIFGGNKADKKIAMTAPVHMERNATTQKMSFVLPSGYQMTDLPAPNDTSIHLHYSEEGYYAALPFGGFAGEQKIQNKEKELQELLLKNGYQIMGAFNYLGYNAPWDIVNRENDIIVKVDYKK